MNISKENHASRVVKIVKHASHSEAHSRLVANLGTITHHADTVWVPSHVTENPFVTLDKNTSKTIILHEHHTFWYSTIFRRHCTTTTRNFHDDISFPELDTRSTHVSIACPPPTSLGWPYTPGIAVSRGLTLSSNVLSMRLNLLLFVMLLKKRIVLSISHLLHPRCNVRITCPVRRGKQEDCFGTSRVVRSPKKRMRMNTKN